MLNMLKTKMIFIIDINGQNFSRDKIENIKKIFWQA